MAAFAAYAMRSAVIQAAATASSAVPGGSVNSGGALATSTSSVSATSASPSASSSCTLQTGGGSGLAAPNNPPPSPMSPQAPPPLPFTIAPQTDKPVHHWREGNLPANSKCSSCKKTCWSAECLTGMRCEWCGVTVSSLLFHMHINAIPSINLSASGIAYRCITHAFETSQWNVTMDP